MTYDSHRLLEDIRVNGGDAIDGVRAHDGEVSHVDPLLRLLLHKRHPTNTVRFVRPPFTHLLRGGGGEGEREGGMGSHKHASCALIMDPM